MMTERKPIDGGYAYRGEGKLSDENSVPTWKKVAAVIVAILLFVVIYLTWNRLGTDFWPLDRSTIGPNIIASVITWAAVLIAAALIWPPTRRRIHRFMDNKLKSHLGPIHAKLDAHARSLEELHQKHDDLAKAIKGTRTRQRATTTSKDKPS